MPLKRNDHIRQRGSAVVELAIVLPLLLLIFLGTAEFGRALFQYNTLTKAVRDGARYISQHSLKGSTGVVDVPSSAVAVVETKNLVVYGIKGGACHLAALYRITQILLVDNPSPCTIDEKHTVLHF